MLVKIRETGELTDLSFSASNFDSAIDFIAGTSALVDGQFTLNPDEGYYLVSQADYAWWIAFLAQWEAAEYAAREIIHGAADDDGMFARSELIADAVALTNDLMDTPASIMRAVAEIKEEKV